MKPNLFNTRELGVGDSLLRSDFIFIEDDDDPIEGDADFIPVGREHDGHIIDGTEELTFRRFTVESPIDAICKEYAIDTDMGREALYIALENVALLNRKHKDYGPGNISATGEHGVVTRIADKSARLIQLVMKNIGPANETVEDSYADISNYGLIGQLLRRNLWK